MFIFGLIYFCYNYVKQNLMNLIDGGERLDTSTAVTLALNNSDYETGYPLPIAYLIKQDTNTNKQVNKKSRRLENTQDSHIQVIRDYLMFCYEEMYIPKYVENLRNTGHHLFTQCHAFEVTKQDLDDDRLDTADMMNSETSTQASYCSSGNNNNSNSNNSSRTTIVKTKKPKDEDDEIEDENENENESIMTNPQLARSTMQSMPEMKHRLFKTQSTIEQDRKRLEQRLEELKLERKKKEEQLEKQLKRKAKKREKRRQRLSSTSSADSNSSITVLSFGFIELWFHNLYIRLTSKVYDEDLLKKMLWTYIMSYGDADTTKHTNENIYANKDFYSVETKYIQKMS